MKISSLRDVISNFVLQLTQIHVLLHNSVVSPILFRFPYFNSMQTSFLSSRQIMMNQTSGHFARSRHFFYSIDTPSYAQCRLAGVFTCSIVRSIHGCAYRSRYSEKREWSRAMKPCVHTCLRLRFILDASPQITLSDKLGHPFSLISGLPGLFVTTLSLHWHVVLLRQWQVWYFRFFMQPIFHAADSAHSRPKTRDFLPSLTAQKHCKSCWSGNANVKKWCIFLRNSQLVLFAGLDVLASRCRASFRKMKEGERENDAR